MKMVAKLWDKSQKAAFILATLCVAFTLGPLALLCFLLLMQVPLLAVFLGPGLVVVFIMGVVSLGSMVYEVAEPWLADFLR